MSRLKLSIPERQVKLEQIAGYDLATLEKATADELRELARGLIDNYTRLRKPELLQALLDITEDQRKAKKLELERTEAALREVELRQQEEVLKLNAALLKTPDVIERRLATRKQTEPGSPSDIGSKVFEELRHIVSTTPDSADIRFKVQKLATRVSGSEIAVYAPTSVKSRATDIKKAVDVQLEELKGNRFYNDMSFAITSFKSSYQDAISEILKTISNKYRRDIATNNQSLKSVNGMALVAKARDILLEVRNGSNPSWKDVSIALVVTTGRRMAEIHSTANFELIPGSDDHVFFTGQLKTRGKNAKALEGFSIPILVAPELVISGLKYLEDTGHRLADPDDVNGKYATPLKRHIKSFWAEVAGTELPYKGHRAIYADIAAHLFKPSDMTPNAYFSAILGHDENDVVTANTYQRFQVIDLG